MNYTKDTLCGSPRAISENSPSVIKVVPIKSNIGTSTAITSVTYTANTLSGSPRAIRDSHDNKFTNPRELLDNSSGLDRALISEEISKNIL